VKAGFADEVSHIRRLRLRGMFLGGSLAVLYQNVVIAVVLVGLGAVYVLDPSHLTALAVVALVLIRAMSYSQSLHGAYHSLRESGPYLERLTDKEISYSMRPLLSGATPVEHIESLRFDDVSYTYPAADGVTARVATEALRNVSFTVDRGRLIGIVGPSGSGKSTLVQLLLGLRVPTAGHLLVNGVDAATLRRDEWFHRVSFVPQEPTLFAGTVAENIAFHRPWVDDDAVTAAARRAHLHDDVLAWEQGYETHVGDRGSQVSGGQRQRICIARALVDNPDIIIFDEPTSALDVHSELAIQQTLEELRLGTFLFIVAHRLSTLDTCDEIMVLARGQLQGFAAAADLQLTNPWFAEALELSSLTDGRRDPSPAPPRSAVS
jgi:ATP-binding cassette, subfamily B, bacterial